jgi:hypothetical protein
MAGRGELEQRGWNPVAGIFAVLGVIGIVIIGVKTTQYERCIVACTDAKKICVDKINAGELPPPPLDENGQVIWMDPKEVEAREINRCLAVETTCRKGCVPMSLPAPR